MPPLLFNPKLMDLHKKRAALRILQRGDDVLLSEISHRLLSRLDDINRDFKRLELAGPLFPKEFPFQAIDHFVSGGHGGSAYGPDLLLSFLHLHWENDPLEALQAFYNRLAPEGLFLGVFWGGDTLHELRHVMVEVESRLTGGAGMHISPMITPYDGAALLQKAGFAFPVVDVQPLTLTYHHVGDLVEDLRTMGETSAFASPTGKALTKTFWREVETHYHTLYARETGRIPATFEAIFLLGWRGQSPPLQREA